MIRRIKLLAGLALASALVACGGGGGSAGTTTGGGNTPTNTTPTVTLELVNASGQAASAVTASPQTFAKATVRLGDAAKTPVAGVVVTFSSDASLVSFVPSTATALTDANGVAQIQVAPTQGTLGGAASLTATANVNGAAATAGTLGVSVTGGGTSTPATVDIFASSTQLQSASASTVTFTAVAKDAQNRALPNQTITFTASSGDLVGALPPKATGAGGEPVTGVSLAPGVDRSNRNITVTATAGGVSQTITIVVTGTTIAISGDSSVLLGGSIPFTVVAKDSSGLAVSNATLTARSSLGNSLTPSALVTDSSGTARFTYRASTSGLDTLSISGLGTSSTLQIAVSAEDFAYESPAANTAVAIGAAQPVTVRLLSGGLPVAGRSVSFSTTRGTVNPATVVTDSNGRASTNVSSTTSGPASVVARTGNAQSVLALSFLAVDPATLVLQASPTAIPPNPSGTSTNQVSLQASVRDASGNAVAGRVVNFTALSDLSNGTISPGSSVTDSNGIATVQFIPGALTTAANGVTVQATVQGNSQVVTGTATLTVSSQSLFISIGRGRTIASLSDSVYTSEMSVYVTDANGAPVPNKTVAVALWPKQYYKGNLFTVNGTDTWLQLVTSQCANEDLNRNGILNAGEDVNGSGRLEPGLPAVVSPATVTTNSSGFGTFNLQYGKNYALWVGVTVTASATVGGTESSNSLSFDLPVLVADIATDVSPPNLFSPYGRATVCTDKD